MKYFEKANINLEAINTNEKKMNVQSLNFSKIIDLTLLFELSKS